MSGTVSAVRLGASTLAPIDRLELVDDPEFPGISIVGLGMVESIRIDEAGHSVDVDLVPTFRGCTALGFIEADIRRALADLGEVSIRWIDTMWSTDRVRTSTRTRLADDYGVVVRNDDGSLTCPICGSGAVRDTSAAGPTRCRSVAWCDDCRNVVEVLS